jgi:hypothetical protein
LYAYVLQYGRPVLGSLYFAGYPVIAQSSWEFLDSRIVRNEWKERGKLTSDFAELAAKEDLCLHVFIFDCCFVKVLEDDVIPSFVLDCWWRWREIRLRRRVECKACGLGMH